MTIYKIYSSKAEILIWCFLLGKIENSTKNPSDNDATEKCTKSVAAIGDKMNEVQDICIGEASE